MRLTTALALVCIVLAFVGAIIEEKLLLDPLAWFVAAIAFNTLEVGYHLGRRSS